MIEEFQKLNKLCNNVKDEKTKNNVRTILTHTISKIIAEVYICGMFMYDDNGNIVGKNNDFDIDTKMTNRDKINAMTNQELAALLVSSADHEEIDYDWDENPYSRFETQYGNDTIGWYDWYNDAIAETIKWLEENVEC